jgi:hypothetical protein
MSHTFVPEPTPDEIGLAIPGSRPRGETAPPGVLDLRIPSLSPLDDLPEVPLRRNPVARPLGAWPRVVVRALQSRLRRLVD